MKKSNLFLAGVCLTHFAFASVNTDTEAKLKAEDNVELYFSPDPLQDHQPWIKQIQSAKKSIQMVIFHLNDKNVISALTDAVKRGVKVQVIVDRLSLILPPFASTKRKLIAGGAEVTACSKGFKITHQKSLVVDSHTALVTSMNLTKKVSTTRDWIVETSDPSVIAEMNAVFATDLENAKTGAGSSPKLTSSNLLWSPVNSEAKILNLINSAKKTIISTVENLGSPTIQTAYIAAAKRGVDVRVITPLCDIADPRTDHNVPFAKDLANNGVKSNMMPDPQTADQPYIHAKMILVDSQQAYIGSVNFSENSLHNSREAGIIFKNSKASAILQNEFNKDWAHAVNANGSLPSCGSGQLPAPSGPDGKLFNTGVFSDAR